MLDLSVSFSKLLVHYSFDVVMFHQMSSGVLEQKNEQVGCCCLWAKPYPSLQLPLSLIPSPSSFSTYAANALQKWPWMMS